MNITSIRIRKLENEGVTKAVATVVFNNEIAINRVRIMEGKRGLFVALPAQKGADGEYRDIAHPITAEGRKALNQEVLKAFDQVVNKEQGFESMFKDGYEFKIVPGETQVEASVPKQEPPHRMGKSEAHEPIRTGEKTQPAVSDKGPPATGRELPVQKEHRSIRSQLAQAEKDCANQPVKSAAEAVSLG